MSPCKMKRAGRALAILAALALPGTVRGQERSVELVPFAGWLVPIEKDGLENAIRQATRRGTFALGARLTVWTSSVLGVELTGGFSGADVRVAAASGSVFPRSTDLWFGSAKLAFNLTPGSGGLGVVLSGGAAGLRIGQPVPDPDTPETRIGGVVGLGLRLPFIGGLSIRGDIEDFIYQADFGLGKKTAQDLVLSAGLIIGF
jgi:hypothetical protein